MIGFFYDQNSKHRTALLANCFSIFETVKAKAFSILLILVMVAPVSVTYTWLKSKKRSVKREIKWRMIEGMDKSDLVLLSFTQSQANSELEWEHSREFEYRGEMYDVVDSKISGDSIHYWCWWDNEETKLNRNLQSLVSIALGFDPENQDKKSQLINFLKLDYYHPVMEWSPMRSFNIIDTPTGHLEHIFSRYISPPTPPPDLG